jgi:hypothetical protein
LSLRNLETNYNINFDDIDYELTIHHDDPKKIIKKIIFCTKEILNYDSFFLYKNQKLENFITAGEVDSPKKFIRAKKNESNLVPVYFSDCRISDTLGTFPVRQTFVDCAEVNLESIKFEEVSYTAPQYSEPESTEIESTEIVTTSENTSNSNPSFSVKSGNKRQNFEYIVGCFSSNSNAVNLVNTLKNQGFDATIISGGNLTRVSIGSASNLKALDSLIQLSNSKGYQGWILK